MNQNSIIKIVFVLQLFLGFSAFSNEPPPKAAHKDYWNFFYYKCSRGITYTLLGNANCSFKDADVKYYTNDGYENITFSDGSRTFACPALEVGYVDPNRKDSIAVKQTSLQISVNPECELSLIDNSTKTIVSPLDSSGQPLHSNTRNPSSTTPARTKVKNLKR